jgi:hypothetical protein
MIFYKLGITLSLFYGSLFPEADLINFSSFNGDEGIKGTSLLRIESSI